MESSLKLCSQMSWFTDCGELEEVLHLLRLSYCQISIDDVTVYTVC